MRVCKHGCDVLDSRCLKKYPNRSHKDKFFCADTYSVGIIFNRNSVKSTAAPFFFLYGCFAFSRCTRLEKWKRNVGESKGLSYLEEFTFGAVKTYLVSLFAQLMTEFLSAVLTAFLFVFLRNILCYPFVTVEKSGYRSLVASD